MIGSYNVIMYFKKKTSPVVKSGNYIYIYILKLRMRIERITNIFIKIFRVLCTKKKKFKFKLVKNIQIKLNC